LLVILVGLGGCGYGFTPSGAHLDPGIKTIFVEPVVNRTTEVHLGEFVRTDLGELFGRSPRFHLTATRAQAGAFLTAVIENLSIHDLTRGPDGRSMEERITITASFALVRPQDGKTIWDVRNLSSQGAYITGQGIAAAQANRQEALKKISRDLTEKAYRMLMSGF
jgi:hypothetical protein